MTIFFGLVIGYTFVCGMVSVWWQFTEACFFVKRMFRHKRRHLDG